MGSKTRFPASVAHWCRSYGFSPSPYALELQGETLLWYSISRSSGEGEIEWRGTVRGKAIEGSLTWRKEGQAPVYYTFSGRGM